MAEKRQAADAPASHVMELLESLISRLLLGGVVLSMATVLIGVVLMFVHHPEYLESAAHLERLTTPGAAFPSTVREVARGVVVGQGQAIIALGLILLIATPIMRVAISVVGFAIERDRTYTVISAVVLALLLISFLLGKTG